MNEHLTLAAGAGGKAMAELLDQVIRPLLSNPLLNQGHDGAYLPGDLCMTTDAYVIRPLEFPGGDIGKLAVCGTLNDLAMCGAQPMYLSCGFIIEEGLAIEALAERYDTSATPLREALNRLVADGLVERREQRGFIVAGISADDLAEIDLLARLDEHNAAVGKLGQIYSIAQRF